MICACDLSLECFVSNLLSLKRSLGLVAASALFLSALFVDPHAGRFVSFADAQKKSEKKKRSTKSASKVKSSKTKPSKKKEASAEKKAVPDKKLERTDRPKSAPITNEKITEASETAIRSLGILVFSGDGKGVEDCEKLSSELALKSYLETTCLKQTMSPEASAAEIAELARSRQVDGILGGAWGADSVSIRVWSGRSGRLVSEQAVSSAGTPEANATSSTSKIDAVVEAIIASFSYRGFVTKVSVDSVEVNLGEKHGVVKGSYLRVFEYVGAPATLQSGRSVTGVIQITDVLGPDLSRGQVVDQGKVRIGAFSKIDHTDAQPPKQAATTRVAYEGSWFLAGVEMMNLNSTILGVQGSNRIYELKNTPFLQLGVGGQKWFGQLWYGYATDNSKTLTYAQALVAYQFKSRASFRSGWTFSAGGWAAQFSESARRSEATNVQADSTRFSPYFEARYQLMMSPRWTAFATGEVQYLIMTSGQNFSQIPFCFSVASTPGIRFNLNDWISLEAGIHYKYLRLPLAGDKGTTENYNSYFARGVLVF